MLWQYLGQRRLGGTAMAAPVRAEFEQGQARHGIDLGTGRGFGFAEVGCGRVHCPIVIQALAAWRCVCGEQVVGGFEQCWNCGAMMPFA